MNRLCDVLASNLGAQVVQYALPCISLPFFPLATVLERQRAKCSTQLFLHEQAFIHETSKYACDKYNKAHQEDNTWGG
jgi:hypothetical protein